MSYNKTSQQVAFVSDTFAETVNKVTLAVAQYHLKLKDTFHYNINPALQIKSEGKSKLVACIYKLGETDVEKCKIAITMDGFLQVKDVKFYVNTVIYDGLTKNGTIEVKYTGLGRMVEKASTDAVFADGVSKKFHFGIEFDNNKVSHFNTTLPFYQIAFTPRHNTNISLEAVLEKAKSQPAYDQVAPPRGVQSLVDLSVKKGTFFVLGERFDSVVIECAFFDFQFLPDFEMKKPSLVIIFDKEFKSEITIVGTVKIRDNIFKTYMIKKFGEVNYWIDMNSDKSLDFYTLENYIVPAISLEKTKLLPNDEQILKQLKVFNLSKSEILIEKPNMNIRLSPYPDIRLRGKHISSDDKVYETMILGALINLDGRVLTNLKFMRQFKIAQRSFAKFFQVLDGDSGFRSMIIKEFNLTSSNRDFDFNRVGEYSNAEVTNIWKMGLEVSIKAKFAPNCTLPLCILYAKTNNTFILTGKVGATNSTLVGPTANLDINGAASFQNVTASLEIEHGKKAALNLKGSLFLIAEPDKSISLKSQLFFDENMIKIEGKMVGVYQDVFKSGLMDMAEITAKGAINSDGTVKNITLSSFAIVGKRSCYKDDQLLNSLAYQVLGDKNKLINMGKDGQKVDLIEGEKCLTGNFLFHTSYRDVTQNRYKGTLNFTNIQHTLGIMMELSPSDKVSGMAKGVTFPEGLLVDYSLAQATAKTPIKLSGEMKFLGLSCYGDIQIEMESNQAALNIQIPPFKLGGGNLRFIGAASAPAAALFKKNADQKEVEEIFFTQTNTPNEITSNFKINHL